MNTIMVMSSIAILVCTLAVGTTDAAEPEARGTAVEDAQPPQPQPPPPTTDEKEMIKELKDKVDQVIEAQKKVLPSEFNPSIGFVSETIFSYTSKGSDETGSDRPGGFDVFQRSMELNVAGSVDPFAKGYAVINGSADASTGEASLEVEEAAIQTTSLPWNLEVKAGRFFGEFGRLAYIHDHELPMVNRPLVLDQYIGGESQTDGLQLNWLVPVEQYISVTLGSGIQFGGDNPPNYVGDFRHGSGLNYWGRISTYFDLTPDISIEPGASGLWNPRTDAQWDPAVQPLPTVNGNTYTERERRLVGADVVVSWKPLRNNQFRAVTWGSEVLYSDNHYDVTDSFGAPQPSRTVGSTGLYSYLIYKWHRQWSGGIVYEWMQDIVDDHVNTSAYSALVTWALSHWNQLRLQYTYTDPNSASGLDPDYAVYLQWAWIIGSHAHGWQAR